MSAALEAARAARLLAKHAPTLAYHRQEPYWASSPGVMTDCHLEGRYATFLQRKSGKQIAQAGPSLRWPRLDLAFLNGDAYGGGAGDPAASDYLNANAGTYVADAARMQADPAYGDRIYGRYAQAKGGRVWLQYWLFYYYNDKSLAGIGLHEGDWEMVQVGLGSGGRPAVATYAQHNGAEKREDWSEVRKAEGSDGHSPLVYVALGSHASYFDPGEYRIKVFPILDHARGNGRRVKPKLVELEGSEPWLAWPGRWGRAGLSDKGSPQGPLQHERQWFRPDEFHERARKKRRKLGSVYFALPESARFPGPSITAERDGDRVVIGYDLRAARGGPESPVRLLLSVDSDDPREAPSTQSFAVARERDRVVHPARLGDGAYMVHATGFTAEDAESDTVTVRVERSTSAPASDREGFALRLLVALPEDWAGGVGAMRKAVDSVLGRDADGRRWKVDHLFPAPPGGGRPKRLRRHLTVTGRAIATPSYPPQQLAFDLAHGLRAETGADVQPDLPSAAFAAPVEPARSGAASFGRGDGAAQTPKGWSLEAIGCQEAWAIEPTRGEGILIGHPDTGYTDHRELEHEALDLDRAWDVIDDDADATDPLRDNPWWPLDSPGHGTATGSVIVGRPAGDITGAAPGATLVPLRTVKSVVQVFDGDVGTAIERARQTGCHVVSMSLGGVGFASAVRDAIVAAVESGMIVMAAAGNYVRFVTAPASWPECLAIGATGIRNEPWAHSSRGREVDFCAPGEGVWVARARREDNVGIRPGNGTSYAVAHTAGVAALWLRHHGPDSLHRRYGKANVQRLFLTLARATATTPAGWDGSRYGTGILNAAALLEAPLPDPGAFGRTAAGGPGPAPAPDPLDRLATLWPDLKKAEVKKRLGRTLGKRGQALEATLSRFGGELFYQYSQDAELRRDLDRPAGASAAGTGSPGPAKIRRAASRALAAEIDS